MLDGRPTLDARTPPQHGLGSVSALSELSRKLAMQSESPALSRASGSPFVAISSLHNDGVSASSPGGTPTRPSDRSASVIGLRDRLIREARNERQRCLEVAEAAERRRSEYRCTSTVATQTDPVIISMPGSLPGSLNGAFSNGVAPGSITPGASRLPSGCVTPVSSVNFSASRRAASPPRLPHGALAPGGSPSHASMANTPTSRPAGWNNQDDEEQAEALRTIQMLGQRSNQASDERVGKLDDQLRRLRLEVEAAQGQFATERSQKDAAQQQVLCLEYELDGKESSLQVAERNLEKRDQDLQLAQGELRSVKDAQAIRGIAAGTTVATEEARVKVMRQQLLERERQLELKDQHISRLLSVLRQHRSLIGDSDDAPSHSLGDLSMISRG